ncbi:unnamed protein product, partial [Meganyctiphanes norvegica]
KSLALPKVFLGLGVMSFTTDQVEAMQVIENTVFRQILRASSLTPNAVLRGEIGSSRMENRMIESRFLFVKSIWEGNNEMIKEVLRKVMDNTGNSWNKKMNQYLEKTDLTNETLYEMSRTELRNKVREIDKRFWINEMEQLKTLEIYRKYKTEIKEVRIYDNRISSKWLFRARSNSLKVNQRSYFLKRAIKRKIKFVDYVTKRRKA